MAVQRKVPARVVHLFVALKHLLMLAIIVAHVSSNGLAPLAAGGHLEHADPATLELDRDRADVAHEAEPGAARGVDIAGLNLDPGGTDLATASENVRTAPSDIRALDLRDYGWSSPRRACGAGPQARLIDVGTGLFEGLNTGDFSAWHAALANDFVAVYAPTGAAELDAVAAETVNRSFRIAFEDLRFELDRVLASASCDYVIVHWTATGTHTGPLATASGAAIPPTGLSGVVTGVYTAEILDGQIVREWTHWDQLSLLIQLGLLAPL